MEKFYVIISFVFLLLPKSAVAVNVKDTVVSVIDTAVVVKGASALAADDDFYSTINHGVMSYEPKAPNVSGLLQYVDCPVSYYTGTPEISIPLYEIDMQDVKIPITLNYHASGIRVSQEATWVGLGWSLECGGVVSRTVRCSDDFHEYLDSYENGIEQGYYDAPEAMAPLDESYFSVSGSDVKLKKDSEPDIFFYSIPGGSGKFLMDKSRGPVLLTKTGKANVKIELDGKKTGQNGVYTFIITDVYGNKYTFRQKEITWVYSRVGNLNSNKPSNNNLDETRSTVEYRYDPPMKYTSSWLLTQITTVKGLNVNFSYEKESYMLPTHESAVKYNYLAGYGSAGTIGSNTRYSCSKTVVESYRLVKVSWNGGTVVFDASERDDVKEWDTGRAPKKLDKVTVKNNLGDMIRQYAFSYSYMNPNMPGDFAYVYKRLMLDKVADCLDTSIEYKMTYFKDHPLPPKNSNNTDYWGYSNGVEQGSDYFCSASYGGKTFFGADKTGNIAYMRSGTLNTLTYPTGEKVTFVYDTHTSTSAPTPVVKDKRIGLAVFNRYESTDYEDENLQKESSKIITFAEDTHVEFWAHLENTTRKEDPNCWYDHEAYPIFRVYKLKADGTKYDDYRYSLTVPSEIKTDYEYNYPHYTDFLTAGTYSFEVYAPVRDVYIAVYFKYKATVLEPGETVSLGGLRIKEIRGTDKREFAYDGAKLLVQPITAYRYGEDYYRDEGECYYHEYLVQNSEAVTPMGTLKDGYIYGYDRVTETRGDNTSVIRTYHNEPETHDSDYPFIPSTPNCYNGLLESESFMRGATCLGRAEYEYTQLYGHTVYGFMLREGELKYYFYKYVICWPSLARKAEMTYGRNGDMEKETNYFYNDDFQLSHEEFRVDGKTYKRKYIYAGDKAGTIYEKMESNHMIGVPVEQQLWHGGQVIRATKTDYADYDGKLLPQSESETENTELMAESNVGKFYRVKVSYGQYTDTGKPMSVTADDGTTVILWGYGGVYPVAVIRNCDFPTVRSLLGDDMLYDVEHANNPGSSVFSALNGLRDRLPEADVTVATFKPLVGVTSITDVRGFCTYYDYDIAGRLAGKSFREGGINRMLEKYTYNYMK